MFKSSYVVNKLKLQVERDSVMMFNKSEYFMTAKAAVHIDNGC